MLASPRDSSKGAKPALGKKRQFQTRIITFHSNLEMKLTQWAKSRVN